MLSAADERLIPLFTRRTALACSTHVLGHCCYFHIMNDLVDAFWRVLSVKLFADDVNPRIAILFYIQMLIRGGVNYPQDYLEF